MREFATPGPGQEVDSTKEELDIQRLWLIRGTISPKSLDEKGRLGSVRLDGASPLSALYLGRSFEILF